MADAIENGVPLVRALDMMAAASEVGAFESAGMDGSTLKLAGTPTAGIVDRPGMITDVGAIEIGKPDGDVSTGPRILEI